MVYCTYHGRTEWNRMLVEGSTGASANEVQILKMLESLQLFHSAIAYPCN